MIIYRRFEWRTVSYVRFNPEGSMLMVSGTVKMIRMNLIDMAEIVVYQCKGDHAGEVRCRIPLRLGMFIYLSLANNLLDLPRL